MLSLASFRCGLQRVAAHRQAELSPDPTIWFMVAKLWPQNTGAEPKNLGLGRGMPYPLTRPVSPLSLLNRPKDLTRWELRDLLSKHEKIGGGEGALLMSFVPKKI